MDSTANEGVSAFSALSTESFNHPGLSRPNSPLSAGQRSRDSGSEHENENVHPSVAAASLSAQRVDDFPIGCFGKRFQRARPDGSQHAQLQVEKWRHSILRSFVDGDHVIIAQ